MAPTEASSGPDDFVVARNPDPASTLPYLVRVPLGRDGVVLKARDVWPRTAKVYCHPATGWPEQPDVVDRAPVRSCTRRGAAIDLVLDRGRENRSQFVFAQARGRQVIFWQSRRTNRKARPAVVLPTRRASRSVLDILVDTRERYPWRFAAQQATTRRAALAVGDYAVEHDGAIVAVVERKSLDDLAATASSGGLPTLLAGLTAVERAALVVEDRYGSVFRHPHVRPGVLAELVAEAQVRVPEVPIVYADTRKLAEEWAYRFLGAALAHHVADLLAADLVEPLAAAGPLDPLPPTAADIRAWARAAGFEVSDRGRIPASMLDAYWDAHPAGD
ncbi:MAG: Lsr2 family protein [Actinomycetota bacterium]|jgi:hypothetical protein|nr:Lsr2 family protein [Actinomycetota bacterium]